MNFDSFADFIEMGGHGAFVWSCYAIVLVAMIGNIIQPLQVAKKFQLMQKKALIQQGYQSGLTPQENSVPENSLKGRSAKHGD